MAKPKKKALRGWFNDNRPVYKRFEEVVQRTLENLLSQNGIPYLGVSVRTKEIESFLRKATRRRYRDPTTDIKDLLGARVITYVDSDAERASALIASAFHIHTADTHDKADELGTDRVGYRSNH